MSSGFDFAKAQANGADIQFTASDGVTAIPFWMESWDAAGSSASGPSGSCKFHSCFSSVRPVPVRTFPLNQELTDGRQYR